MFSALYGTSEHAFWLDSARVEAGLSRYSYMGPGTGPYSEVVHYNVTARTVRVATPDGRSSEHALPSDATFYSWLQARMAGLRAEVLIEPAVWRISMGPVRHRRRQHIPSYHAFHPGGRPDARVWVPRWVRGILWV